MTAAQDLVADPLGFFKKNIVIIHGANPTESNWQATTDFSLLPAEVFFGEHTQGTRSSSVLRKTKTVEIYYVAPYNNDPATLFNAYWCGYQDDAAKFQMLGNAATLVLTHRMDGCTFAVGSPTPTGEVLVGHFNIQVNGRTDVGVMRDSAKLTVGRNAKMLDKTRYMGSNASNITTTFGFKQGSRWKFYHQRYRPHGMSYKLVDVRSL